MLLHNICNVLLSKFSLAAPETVRCDSAAALINRETASAPNTSLISTKTSRIEISLGSLPPVAQHEGSEAVRSDSGASMICRTTNASLISAGTSWTTPHIGRLTVSESVTEADISPARRRRLIFTPAVAATSVAQGGDSGLDRNDSNTSGETVVTCTQFLLSMANLPFCHWCRDCSQAQKEARRSEEKSRKSTGRVKVCETRLCRPVG